MTAAARQPARQRPSVAAQDAEKAAAAIMGGGDFERITLKKTPAGTRQALQLRAIAAGKTVTKYLLDLARADGAAVPAFAGDDADE